MTSTACKLAEKARDIFTSRKRLVAQMVSEEGCCMLGAIGLACGVDPITPDCIGFYSYEDYSPAGQALIDAIVKQLPTAQSEATERIWRFNDRTDETAKCVEVFDKAIADLYAAESP